MRFWTGDASAHRCLRRILQADNDVCIEGAGVLTDISLKSLRQSLCLRNLGSAGPWPLSASCGWLKQQQNTALNWLTVFVSPEESRLPNNYAHFVRDMALSDVDQSSAISPNQSWNASLTQNRTDPLELIPVANAQLQASNWSQRFHSLTQTLTVTHLYKKKMDRMFSSLG